MNKQEKLIEAIREGRNSMAYNRALSQIYTQHYSIFVKRLSSGRFQLTQTEAIEKYVEAITILVGNILDGKEVQNIRAYLWIIAKHKAWQWIDGRERERRHLSIVKAEQKEAMDANDTLVAQDCRVFYDKLRPLLGSPCNDILLLKEEGYSSEEIADRLQYTSKNRNAVIRVTLQRCRNKLKKIIDSNTEFKRVLRELFEK